VVPCVCVGGGEVVQLAGTPCTCTHRRQCSCVRVSSARRVLPPLGAPLQAPMHARMCRRARAQGGDGRAPTRRGGSWG
jgi:hypothetical protein